MAQTFTTKRALLGVSALALALTFAVPQDARANGLFDDMMGGVHDWSGPYVGVQGGFAWGDGIHSFSNGAPRDNSDPEGFFGGGHAGFNIQLDNIVFGFEGDVEGGDIDGSFQNLTGGTSSGSSEINVQGSLRGRVGYAIGNIMPYITAGFAIADVDWGGGPAGGPCCSYSTTMAGWTAGGGLEFAFTDWASLRVEYRYTDYGYETGALNPVFPGVIMGGDLEIHSVRAGFSISLGDFFGGP